MAQDNPYRNIVELKLDALAERQVKVRLIAAAWHCPLGCSTVGGWFDSGPAKEKPAELVEFKPTASLAEAGRAKRATPPVICFRPWPKATTSLRSAARWHGMPYRPATPCGRPMPA